MADTKMVTPGALDKLAKLLAAENIMIEHKPIKTAYFDVKNRVLALPMWKEMTESLYHMLVLHEVGHALDTPAEGWKGSIDEVKEKDGGRTAQTFQGYLNVVEDARIERKIKTKFPGSRKDFIDGYNWLHDQDFFSVKTKDIDAMTLIDRINLYFKLGTRIRINFTDEERAFVRRAEQTITFDDVIKLAQDIMAYAKAKNEEEEQQQTTAMEDMIGEEDSDEFSHDDFDADESQDSDGDGDEETEQQESSDENRAEGGQNGREGGRDPKPLDHGVLDSMTDRAMNDRMEELLDETLTGREFRYVMFPKDLTHEPFTRNYKEVLGWIESDFARGGADMIGYRTFLLNKFRMENNAAINYMVKEFEMKKAAIAYSRSKQAKTGVIDTNKLHSYKFNDDIFKRLSIEPTGKNHGVVSILDMSGSMAPSYRGAMDQLISLAMFCRRVGIPHRFYGFTSVIPHDSSNKRVREALKEKIAARLNKSFVFPVDGDFDLLELFHEGMSVKEFNTMVGSLLVSSTRYGNGYYNNNDGDEYVTSRGFTSSHSMIVAKMGQYRDMDYFKLGGTPLNDAIIVSRDLMRKFRKEKKIQIMNYICITDGESNYSTYVTNRRGYANQLLVDTFPNGSSRTTTNIFVDEETHMQTTINFNDGGIGVTGMFARMVRESENARFIGFYIANSAYDIRNAIYRYLPYSEQEKAKNSMAKTGSIVIPKMLNFEEFYLIRGGKNLEAQQAKFEEARDLKKSQLAKAFISAQNKRGTSRVILGRFIEKIAA